MASVLPTTIGCTDALCVGSSGAPDPKSLRMIILTIILVQVLCCHSITKITRNGINGAMFVTAGFTQSQRYGFGLALDEDQSQILRGVRQPGGVVMFTGHGDGRLDGIGFAARVGRTIKGYSTSRKWPCFRFA